MPRMRQIREIVSAGALTLMGCDGIATVEVERSSMALLYADEEPGEIDFGEFENNQDVGSEDIAGAHVTSVVVEVMIPVGGDLSFADSVEVYIDAPGLEPRLLASQDDFPEGKSRVALEPSGLDLEAYVIADRIGFTAVINGEPPPDDVLIEASAQLDVRVTAAGVCNAM